MAKEEIKKMAVELKVPGLVHFTRVANLPSILRHGLHPVTHANAVGFAPEVNDHHRLDGHRDGISLSIAFPNSKMFYKYRMENAATNWVVLGLDAAILWEKDCIFCKHNAADSRISRESVENLKSAEAFRGMFDEIEGVESRGAQKLRPYDPTDLQAEVMVLQQIEPYYIKLLAFDSVELRDAHLPILSAEQKAIVFPKGKGLFAARSYNRLY